MLRAVDVSGDVEKNPGPHESGGEELPAFSNGTGRERSNTTSIATHGASRQGIPATERSPFDVGLYAFPNARRRDGGAGGPAGAVASPIFSKCNVETTTL